MGKQFPEHSYKIVADRREGDIHDDRTGSHVEECFFDR